MGRDDNVALIRRVNELVTGFGGIVVAAIRGRAIGFGCGLAVLADVTIAEDSAQFGFDEILHGFAPRIVVTYLQTYVAPKLALDLITSGRLIPAAEALRAGLVTEVVPYGALDRATRDRVDALLARDGAALREARAQLRLARDHNA